MKKDEFARVMDDLHKSRIPGGVKKAVETLLDKKAENVTVLKLKGRSEMTDYLVVCSGNSARQNKALADAVRDTLKKNLHLQPLGSEGEVAAEWILVDYVDFIVNVFSAEWRKKYSLEKLWMDAKRYDFSPGF
ncbi:MAG: ribosome silencing factor [Acidobacteriota bacterium]|jgi:ribosome-associated protein|nr:ribosome silencing factor [Acidobacteriota bacterium]